MSFLIRYWCVTWGLVPLTGISLCYFGLFAIQTTNWKIDQWEEKMKYKTDYRGLINRISTVTLSHNHQTMPCYIFWRKKALNQLSLVSFLIIKMKTARRNTEGVFLLKMCSLGNMSSSSTFWSIYKSLVQLSNILSPSHGQMKDALKKNNNSGDKKRVHRFLC